MAEVVGHISVLNAVGTDVLFVVEHSRVVYQHI